MPRPRFGDPDGEALTRLAESEDPGVAMAALPGASVSLAPVSDGTANRGADASQTLGTFAKIQGVPTLC